MSARLQELDWQDTPMGELSLRRRRDPRTGEDVYEVKLGDEFLMSSMFTVAEEEAARLALAEQPEGPLDVAVGGLGLGYTARAALEYSRVASVTVVEALGAVIDWNQRGLVPAGAALAADTRCRMVHGDFFTLAADPAGLDPHTPGRRFHAVVVDIDHSPRHLLDPAHAAFYEPAGLRRLADHLHPGGTFALWSNDPPDDDFTAILAGVFDRARAERVTFHNPLQERDAANTVYLATTAAD
ncbi:hypothetical protein FHX37_3227 [Haloactinospora alba]|uniref:Spermidine synthase n=1 Tax=Haloactinospora alba TaxID=405555 RepID=A0A543NN22_9ACTN|nr:spermidine synthase [Haloactinospora alba]TQN33222.1 hypothetical protein FHX37_3227 [Haloactinospora alba]